MLRFLRREGRDEDAARELAQEFFARVLSSGGLGDADPARGKFRSYLLGALKHFLADQRKRAARLKRGGGITVESIESTETEESQSQLDPAGVSFPASDRIFDREWALTVMARALSLLEREFAQTGRPEQFSTLKAWLAGEVPSMSQAEAARRLGLSEGAVKVAIHRLRKRFRDALRNEISQTLWDPSQIDEELRHLIAACA